VRSTVVLALLPTIVLAIGIARGGGDVLRGLLLPAPPRGFGADLLLLVTAVGYVAFVAVYGYRFRDYATMKGIFVCPGALAFLTWLVREFERPGNELRAKALKVAYASTWALCAAYLADTGTLVYWLIHQAMLSRVG
jgi:hypothetical protein